MTQLADKSAARDPTNLSRTPCLDSNGGGSPLCSDTTCMSEMGSSCWLIGNHWYGYSMWNMWAGLDITEISLIPTDGQIDTPYVSP